MKLDHHKRIAFIGAGNVAWHLSQALVGAGHEVVSVYSRTVKSAEVLCSLLPGAKPISDLNMKDTDAEIIIIAVPDAVLNNILKLLKIPEGVIIAHTSGSQPLAILDSIKNARTGVFYPLQTFSKSKQIDLSHAPILIEAKENDTKKILEALALSISTQVLEVSSTKRKQLHLSAVFACNFTNHLLGISRQLLQEASLPEELLQPLIQETITKANLQNPYTVQTGPAIRRDNNVINDHIKMLESHPRLQELYRALTLSIQQTDTEE
jgi:predicted short-subunit dehydrogenase-like oxidoreductase (DUF2520 family)